MHVSLLLFLAPHPDSVNKNKYLFQLPAKTRKSEPFYLPKVHNHSKHSTCPRFIDTLTNLLDHSTLLAQVYLFKAARQDASTDVLAARQTARVRSVSIISIFEFSI